MGAAQANASRARTGFYGDRISAILYRHALDAHSDRLAQQTSVAPAADREILLLPAPSRAALRSTWTMRPPAAESAAVFAHTSFARSAL